MDRLTSIERRLSDSEYLVSRDVQLPGGGTAKIVASRTYFSWKGFVILSQHLVVCKMEQPTVADMQKLFQDGFHIGKKRNRVPLVRGLQFGYMIVPVIIADVVSDELIQHVSQHPKKHWCLFEYPVVCNANSKETYYFKGTSWWGALFFSDLRDVVSTYIE